MALVVRRTSSRVALASLDAHDADDVVFVVATRDVYLFDASSSATHDGSATIKPDNLLARKPGRWLRAKFKAEDMDGSDGIPSHASQHKSAGADPIKLDELAAPTDVTTLNVSASAHGLAPKLPGDASQVLDGSGAYQMPPGESLFLYANFF